MHCHIYCVHTLHKTINSVVSHCWRMGWRLFQTIRYVSDGRLHLYLEMWYWNVVLNLLPCLCRAKGIAGPTTRFLWFVQTILFGFASLGLLIKYKPDRLKHQWVLQDETPSTTMLCFSERVHGLKQLLNWANIECQWIRLLWISETFFGVANIDNHGILLTHYELRYLTTVPC